MSTAPNLQTTPEVKYALFDVQLAPALSMEWLRGAVGSEGVTSDRLGRMFEKGLLPPWRDKHGNEGFILYTPHQAGVVRRLEDSGRYEDDELRYIVTCWNEYIEAVLMTDPSYDDDDVPEMEHCNRRIAEDLAMFQDSRITPSGQMKADAERTISELLRVQDLLASATTEVHSPMQQRVMQQVLARLRWIDEFVRLNSAATFEAVLTAGYSPQTVFDSYEHNLGGGVKLGAINWRWTLDGFRQSRAEGNRYPLRTPVCDVDERGIKFHYRLSPDDYGRVWEAYRLGELFHLLDTLGRDLWFPPLAGNQGECAECGARFSKRVSTKQYCNEKCKKRAKHRRWRERDPERARLSQARYYSSAYGSVTTPDT